MKKVSNCFSTKPETYPYECMRITRTMMFIMLLSPFMIQAQSIEPIESTQLTRKTRVSDASRFTDAFTTTAVAPSRWKGKDWLKFGGMVAGTAVLTLADQPIRKFWLSNRSDFLDAVNETGYHYGKPYSAAIPSGIFYLAGVLFKDEWSRETGLALGTSFLLSSMVEATLKPLVGRARPITGEDHYEITFFNKDPGFHSFPSGHATTAFTISFVMAQRVKSIPLKVLFYSLAASTAVCRMYSDAHWTSDIAFGSTVAWFCSEAVLKRLSANRMSSRPSKFLWSVSPSAGGLTVRATF